MRGRLTIVSARTVARRGALLACTVMTACCSTGPEENAWGNVESFEWHEEDNNVRYDIDDKLRDRTDTVMLSIRDSMDTALAKIQVLEQVESAGVTWPIITTYTSGDTLFIHDRLPSRYALVGPIREGQTWISAYRDTSRGGPPQLAPSWRGQITGLFLQYHDDASNSDYANVVRVVYRPIVENGNGEFWVRYFAKGVGPIRTEKFLDPFPDPPLAPFEIETIVLIPD